MMLHFLGAALFPICGWLAGDAVLQTTRAHLRALEQVERLLQRVRAEILFRQADLALLYEQLRREGLLTAESPAGTLQRLPAPEPLSAEERLCFADCMSGLGRTDAQQECQRLDYYITRFQQFRQQAGQAARAQAELPHRLGFAAGMVLMILFL